MPIFKSRASANKSGKAATEAKSQLERQIEKEIAVMCVAMPFLPRDQVRGMVLKKLGLETGNNGKQLLRKGGARVDYRNLSIKILKSQGGEAEGMEAPRTIRKKLLGHSEGFQVEGRRPPQTGRQEATADDSFGFLEEHTPVQRVPKIKHKAPPRKIEEQRNKRAPKKRSLFSCVSDDSCPEDIEEITDAFDTLTSNQPVNPPVNYGRAATTKKPIHKIPAIDLPPPRKNPPPMRASLHQLRRALEVNAASEIKAPREVVHLPVPRKNPQPTRKVPEQRRRASGDIHADGNAKTKEVLPLSHRNPQPIEEPEQCRPASEDILTDGNEMAEEVLPSPRRNPQPMLEVPEQRRRASEDTPATEGKQLTEEVSPSFCFSQRGRPTTQSSSSKKTAVAASGSFTLDTIDTMIEDPHTSPIELATHEEPSSFNNTNITLSPAVKTPSGPHLTEQQGTGSSGEIFLQGSSSKAATSGQLSDDSFSPENHSSPIDLVTQGDQTSSFHKNITLSPAVKTPSRPHLNKQKGTGSSEKISSHSSSSKAATSGRPTADHSSPMDLATQGDLSSSFHTKSTLHPPSQTPLRPYLTKQQGTGSSEKISSHSSSSKAATSGRPPADHSSPMHLATQGDLPLSLNSKSTLHPRSQTPLRPYPAIERSSSANISTQSNLSKDRSLRQAENASAEMDQSNSFRLIAGGASGFLDDTDDVSPPTSSSVESASQIPRHLQSAQQQSRSAAMIPDNIITTPTTSMPCRGLSTKKGQPWTKQVPAWKITSRRAMFQCNVPHDFQESPNQENQDQNIYEFMRADQEPGRSSPREDEQMAFDDEQMVFEDDQLIENDPEFKIESPTKRLSRFAIPLTPLLLKKGADRIDGLPFSSGEAVRPVAPEWLHCKKLSSQEEQEAISPKTPIMSAYFPSANLRYGRAVVPTMAYIETRMNCEADLPTEAARTSPVLQLSEEASNVSSQKSATWWQDNAVLNALKGLGVEELMDTASPDLPPTQPVSQTSPQSSSTQGSSIRRSAPNLFSSQICQGSATNPENIAPMVGSDVSSRMHFSSSNQKTSEQSSKPFQVPALSWTEALETTSQHSDESSQASTLRRSVSDLFSSPMSQDTLTPVGGSGFQKWVPSSLSSGDLKTSQRSSKPLEAPILSPTQASETSQHSDESSQASSSFRRYQTFSLKKN